MKWHKFDVFKHIMAALNGVPSMKLHVRLAAMLHDVGKPGCRTENNGVVHFYGHDNVSASMARVRLAELGFSNDIINKTSTLIANHMYELDFNKTITPKMVRRLIGRVGEGLIKDLVDLRIGDRIGSGKPCLTMGKVAKFIQLIEEEMSEPLYDRKHLAINGDTLIELGYKPSEEFKHMLDYLLERVMEDPSLNNRGALVNIIQNEYRRS